MYGSKDDITARVERALDKNFPIYLYALTPVCQLHSAKKYKACDTHSHGCDRTHLAHETSREQVIVELETQALEGAPPNLRQRVPCDKIE